MDDTCSVYEACFLNSAQLGETCCAQVDTWFVLSNWAFYEATYFILIYVWFISFSLFCDLQVHHSKVNRT